MIPGQESRVRTPEFVHFSDRGVRYWIYAPGSKARGERSCRSRVKQALRSRDAESADAVASELHRDDFGKSPDAPLAEHVEGEWRHRGSPRLARSELREEAKRRLRRGRAPTL